MQEKSDNGSCAELGKTNDSHDTRSFFWTSGKTDSMRNDLRSVRSGKRLSQETAVGSAGAAAGVSTSFEMLP